MKKINPRYHVFDFCNGELSLKEDFESSTEVYIYLLRHFLEDPVIIYGFDLTGYFTKVINK